jgi:hypothetical protein
MHKLKDDSDSDTAVEESKHRDEESKDVDARSQSPNKMPDHTILVLFKEYYTKSRILGENTSLIPLIIAPAYLGIRKIVTLERMTFDRHKVNIFK